MIDLAPFYDKNESRSNIAAPFSDAEHTYATDGKIIVRVPLCPNVPQSDFAPKAEQLFPLRKPEKMNRLPVIPDARFVECPKCEEYITVPDYTGIGVARFDNKYLRKIAALPNALFAVTDESSGAYFTFDGGDGLLMPVRL